MIFDTKRVNNLLRASGVIAADKVSWIDQVESTNDLLMAAENFHGKVIIAGEQTAGRGRRGRHWQAPYGSSLLMSIGWEMESGQSAGLSLVCGLTLKDALDALGVSGVQLKWPNDALMAGLKIAGILIEVSAGKCIIGIGVNVKLSVVDNETTLELNSRRTDLAAQGFPIELEDLAVTLISLLCQRLEQFQQGGFQPWIAQWNQTHAFHNKIVQVAAGVSGAESINGRVIGVDHLGGLILQTEAGEQVFYAGDVSMSAVQ